jgi:exonuclease III
LILNAGYTDCYRTQHPSENGFTLFSDYPWARIDYVFASPRLADRLVACDVARGEWELEASHHFPVWAEFR